MSLLSESRWNGLWARIASKGEAAPWFSLLCGHYDEPHRHYHTSRHILECLDAFDVVRKEAAQPDAVELAIWFHDVIYDTRAGDNEDRSAELARHCLAEAGAADAFSTSVADLVMATKTHDPGSAVDSGLLLDIDLGILGQPPARFMEYEEQIRKEYGWVPDEQFASGRAAILERFLARNRIFTTNWFFQRFEKQAKTNLQASLERLRGGQRPPQDRR